MCRRACISFFQVFVGFRRVGLPLCVSWFFYNNWKIFLFNREGLCCCCLLGRIATFTFCWNSDQELSSGVIPADLLWWPQAKPLHLRWRMCAARLLPVGNTDSEFFRKKQGASSTPPATVAANVPIATVIKAAEAAVPMEASRRTWEQLRELMAQQDLQLQEQHWKQEASELRKIIKSCCSDQ